MSDWEDRKKDFVTAVQSLAIASSTATATGFADVAEASESVRYVITNNFNFYVLQAPPSQEIPDHDITVLEEKVRALEAQIRSVNVPSTESFRCQQDFETCVRNATSKVLKAACLMSYVACLSYLFVKVTVGIKLGD